MTRKLNNIKNGIDKQTYVDLALASVEMIQENNMFCGSLPQCPGVWAQAETEQKLKIILKECFEDWIDIRLKRGWEIPTIQVKLASN